MKRYILFLVVLVFLPLIKSEAQVVENDVVRVELMQTPDEYSMMYVTDLINDPANAPIIFQIRLIPKVTDPEISIEAEFTADVPDLGLTNEQIFWVETNPFELIGDVLINNRDLAEQSNVVSTSNGPMEIGARAENVQYIQGERQDELVNSILAMPMVPPGVYTFRYTIHTNQGNVSDVISIEFASRPSVQLVAPANEAVIQTTYPVFQWESSGATRNCNYGIRICEFDPEKHSSLEEALNDESNLPFPDNGEYFELSSATSFQYPLTGAKEIEEGRQYVWQIQKYCETTRGMETVESEIFKFAVGGEQVDPVSLALQSVLGQDMFDQYFGVGGELAGYSADPGNIMVDGEVVSMSELMELSTQFSTGQHTIISVQVQE
ncbi:MAG: hypothetical protein K9N46_13580 [Candidatus Marinimicrobia bacterium]|nr:hypothetical protein [Candidatus Neomarinimicrobiota bacterium]MCF7829804.1 hypothetical protein [Candidatus Neomarinimicrobiota bacterium]MCF7881763.1 hypothetical protein [Candidatus Neomarinimicrobiota bacterium]